MKIIYLLLSLLILNSCALNKPDNLDVFLEKSDVIFNLNNPITPNYMDKEIELSGFRNNFTITFWINSNNFSHNGVLFSFLENQDNELNEGLITGLISKRRIGVLSKGKDLRKVDGNFSQSFLQLEELDLNQKYFVTFVYNSQINKLIVYIDGELYYESKLNINFNNQNYYLRLGYTIDNSKYKYLMEGVLSNIYVFPDTLSVRELNLLMNLTLTKNYPL